MANTTINVRCSDPVIELLDKVCGLYGFSRSEVMRTGAISYCQQLLMMDTLQRLNDTCHLVADKANNNNLDQHTLDEMDELCNVLCKHLGVE